MKISSQDDEQWVLASSIENLIKRFSSSQMILKFENVRVGPLVRTITIQPGEGKKVCVIACQQAPVYCHLPQIKLAPRQRSMLLLAALCDTAFE